MYTGTLISSLFETLDRAEQIAKFKADDDAIILELEAPKGPLTINEVLEGAGYAQKVGR